jgi:hypothetical protein
MNKNAAGLVFGAGIGLGIGWLVARGGKNDNERIMILKKRPNGTPGLDLPPDDVEIRAGKRLTWWIVNLTDLNVEVSIKNWRNQNNVPKPPAVSADPDDDEGDDRQNGLSRMVGSGTVKKIRSKARLPEGIIVPEEVYYDVYLNGVPAVDPIVKLVL